jgi:hypothetical protein
MGTNGLSAGITNPPAVALPVKVLELSALLDEEEESVVDESPPVVSAVSVVSPLIASRSFMISSWISFVADTVPRKSFRVSMMSCI